VSGTDLQARTKSFALSVIRYSARLSRTTESEIITRQLLGSAMSVGANYRAACRARSRADFVAKLSIVEEEADECGYCLKLRRPSRTLTTSF
jgi:four helix bundle protein